MVVAIFYVSTALVALLYGHVLSVHYHFVAYLYRAACWDIVVAWLDERGTLGSAHCTQVTGKRAAH